MDVTALKDEFERISGITCRVHWMPAPHQPNSLLDNEQGVYVFITSMGCLKVGKAGPKSKARFNSHHYRANSTKSCLANSILSDNVPLKRLISEELHAEINQLTKQSIPGWIKKNTSRIEFFISSVESPHTLNFLEAFIQFKLKPVYEGKNR